MSVEHKNLTGASLHEPKGVASAADGTVYIADGAGSGAWSDPTADINNKNFLTFTGTISNLCTPSSSCLISSPVAGNVVQVSVVCESNFTVAPNVLTAEIVSAGVAAGAGVATDLSISCTHGSGVNAVFRGDVSSGNSMTTSQAVLIKTDGGGTGTSLGVVSVIVDVA